MDISKINLSKDKFHSEDAVFYEIIDKQYVIIINSDGNGSIGLQSQKVSHNFSGDGLLEFGSMIAITTDYYTKRIFTLVINQIKVSGFNLKSIMDLLNNIIINEVKKDIRSVCFCFLLNILDFNEKKMYTFGIGDCGYSIIDLDTKKSSSKTLQKTNCLAFNGRGNALISCPSSIHNNVKYIQDSINIKVSKLPNNFVFLQYSDGLDYDIAVPVQMIEEELNIVGMTHPFLFTDPNIIKIHNKINKKILKDDSPNTSYSRYNLTRNEMLKITVSNTSSQKIISEIIEHVNSLPNNRAKIDDISLCVLYFKLF